MAVLSSVQFAHPEGALSHTLSALPDADIRVLREAGTDPEHVVSVFMFQGPQVERITDVLRADPSVARTHPMPNYRGTHVFGIEFAPDTKLLAPTVTEQQGFALEAKRADPDSGLAGWQERWLFASRAGLNAVWEHARDAGYRFEVLSISRFRPEGSAATGALTEEQRETIAYAYDRGFFEEPRGTSLEELAEELDLSSTAVGGRIRRGINALVKATVIEETTTDASDDARA